MNDIDRAMVLAVVDVIKKRFPNLTAIELINMSMDILDATNEVIKKSMLVEKKSDI